MTQPPLSIRDRVRTFLDLHEFGVAMVRQRFARQHPQASPAELESMVAAWLLEPGQSAPGSGFEWRRPEGSGGR